MELAVHQPLAAPVPVRRPNPVGTGVLLASAALAAVGVGFGVAGFRARRSYGKLECAQDKPVVGVPLAYQGDWWADRGRRLYWKVRRAGATTAPEIARAIIAADIGNDSPCLAQFPPHSQTHERNITLWNGMLEHVQQEMASERASA